MRSFRITIQRRYGTRSRDIHIYYASRLTHTSVVPSPRLRYVHTQLFHTTDEIGIALAGESTPIDHSRPASSTTSMLTSHQALDIAARYAFTCTTRPPLVYAP